MTSLDMDISSMQANAGKASTLLSAMANPKRLMILCQLYGGERAVGELAELLDTRQSTISQHLTVLRKDGFVKARRDGQMQYYSLATGESRAIIETLHALYCEGNPAGKAP